MLSEDAARREAEEATGLKLKIYKHFYSAVGSKDSQKEIRKYYEREAKCS